MFCRKCGNQINPGSAFCNNCGAPIDTNQQPVNNYQNNAAPNMGQNTYQAPQPNMYQNPGPNVGQNMYQNTQQNAYIPNPNMQYNNQNVYTNGSNVISEDEFLRKVKGTKSFCIIVGVLTGLGLLGSLINGNLFSVFSSVASIVLLICFYINTRDRKLAGPILGFVVSGIYFLDALLYIIALFLAILIGEGVLSYIFSIFFDIIIGISVLKDCIAMYKFIKSNKVN